MFKLLASILLLITLFLPINTYAFTDTAPDPEQVARRNQALDKIRNNGVVKNMSGSTAQVTSSATYTDPKTSKVKGLISKIPIPANKTKLAKELGKGVGTNLIALAIYDMLGKAVDWVLDPANNQVIIKEQGKYCGGSDFSVCVNSLAQAYPKLHAYYDVDGWDWRPTGKCDFVGDHIQCEIYNINDETRTYVGHFWFYKVGDDAEIPLDTLAEEIIKLAEKQNQLAQELLKQLAERELKTGVYADELVANAIDVDANQMQDDMDALNNPDKQKQSEGETEKDKEKDGETETDKKTSPFELPKFCDWADWFCEDEKERQGEKVTVNELQYKNPSEFDTNYVNFGGACPAMQPFTVMNVTLRFDLTPLCQFAVEVRPAVLAVSYLFALAIVVSAFKI